jgi:predicted MFS family arabinose efflux permease
MPDRRPRVIYPVVLVDALLMFAIVPLLPRYSGALHLSKAQAGLVVGAYSGAVLVGSPFVGQWSARVGPRRLTILGVALLAAATFAYAGALSFWVLLAARIGQGVSSAISWTAGLAWLSQASPAAERGRVLGAAMSFAAVGTVAGPAAGGALAAAFGLRVPFVVLGFVAVALTVACLAAPDAGRGPAPVPAVEMLRRVRSSTLVLAALAIMTLVATVSGTLDTLIPLRLGADGYSTLALTVVLTASGVLATACNYMVGVGFDRFGGVPIAVASMIATGALVAVLVLDESAVTLIAVFLVSTAPIAGQYAVAFPLCAAGADRVGLAHSNVFGLLNLSWGAGFLVGPAAGAAIAQVGSDRVTYAVLVVLTIAATAWMRRLALR